MANDIETWDRGELVTTIGPLSIFRSASAFTPEGAQNDSEIQIVHRYTIRVDSSWVTTGGIVALEVDPPYFAVTTGNRLDTVESLVELVRNPESEAPQINVLVVDAASTVDQSTSDIALTVRCE